MCITSFDTHCWTFLLLPMPDHSEKRFSLLLFWRINRGRLKLLYRLVMVRWWICDWHLLFPSHGNAWCHTQAEHEAGYWLHCIVTVSLEMGYHDHANSIWKLIFLKRKTIVKPFKLYLLQYAPESTFLGLEMELPWKGKCFVCQEYFLREV